MTRQNQGIPAIWKAVGVTFIVLLIVTSAVFYFWLGPMIFQQDRQTGKEVVDSTYSEGNALSAYRDFRQLYHDIEAQRNQIENVYEEEEQFHKTYGDNPQNWSRTAEIRHGRIHERITGNKQHLESMVAEYNAKSDDATQELFKCNLPYKVDEQFAIHGPPGSGGPEEPVDTGPNGEPVNGIVSEQCDGLPDNVSA